MYAWSNNTTKIIGNHTMKFGVFIERSGQNDHIQFTTASAPATINENGSFRFLDTGRTDTTDLAIGNTLLGLFNDYSELGGKPMTPWVATALRLVCAGQLEGDSKADDRIWRSGILSGRHGIAVGAALLSSFRQFYDPAEARERGSAPADSSQAEIRTTESYFPAAECRRPRAIASRVLHTGQFDRLYHCLPEGLRETHCKVFQPRLGVAYAFTPKMALRAGMGMFANRTAINRDTALGGNAPFQPQTTVINGSADAPAGATPRLFPFTLTSQDPGVQNPGGLELEHHVSSGNCRGPPPLKSSYVGRRGIHNQRKRNINQLLPGTVQANPTINPNALRPYLGLGILGLAENSGLSMYNGLQISVERRFAHGFQFGVAYTLLEERGQRFVADRRVCRIAYDDKDYWGYLGFRPQHM